ncbi:WecE Predicted pyridoxal phosphate-dependent enzyme apparently involved in regulation of cell wall biogenesis [Candidatus Nanopelagicaceae bacterium]
MSIKVPLSAANIDHKDIEIVSDSLQSRNLSGGEAVSKFEEKLASYLGVREVVAVSSATTGIELALATSLNLKTGDEVLVPAFTFPACINSVIARGLKPRLVDIDPVTLNIDVDQLSQTITRKTKLVIPVDAFGTPCNIEKIRETCEKRGVKIVQDAACALGSKNKEGFVGNSDHPVIFSFHQRKIITTGEGGCIATNDLALANKMRQIRSHGAMRGEYFATFINPGFNFRMTEMSASLGLNQLEKLNYNIRRQAEVATRYRKLLCDLSEVDLSSAQEFEGRIMQSFIIKVSSEAVRNSLIGFLRNEGIESTIGTYDLTSQPAYVKYLGRGDFPNARKAGQETIALPIFSTMTDSQIEYVCEKVIAFFRKIN